MQAQRPTVVAKFEHDCDKCQFVGHFKAHDIYWCTSCEEWVCRYSSDGPDYVSMTGRTLDQLLRIKHPLS